jgi:hypothetical protein
MAESLRGTQGSNPFPSSAESGANSLFGGPRVKARGHPGMTLDRENAFITGTILTVEGGLPLGQRQHLVDGLNRDRLFARRSGLVAQQTRQPGLGRTAAANATLPDGSHRHGRPLAALATVRPRAERCGRAAHASPAIRCLGALSKRAAFAAAPKVSYLRPMTAGK